MNWLHKTSAEIFRTLGFAFNIDKAKQLCSSKSAEQLTSDETQQSLMPMIRIDKEYALKTDLSKPVILATIAFGKNQLSSMLIDGYHRVYQAVQKQQGISAYILSFEETLSILETPDMQKRMLNLYNGKNK